MNSVIDNPRAARSLNSILATLRVVWSFNDRPGRFGAGILICLAIKLGCDVAFPWGTKHLIDDIIPSNNLNQLVRWALVLATVVLISASVTYMRILMGATLAARVLTEARRRCFEKIHRLSLREFGASRTGDLLSRVTNDTEHLRSLIESVLPALLFESATLMVVITYSFYLSGALTLIVMGLATPVFGSLYWATNRSLRKSSLQLQVQMGELTSVASEHLNNQPIVAAFNLSGWASRTFSVVLEKLYQTSRRIAKQEARLSGGTDLVFQGIRVLVLSIGAWMVLQGRMSLGALIAFLSLMSGLIAPFITVASYFSALQTASGAINRISDLLSSDEGVRSGTTSADGARGAIEFRNVTVKHRPDSEALVGVSISIPAGSFAVLTGPSGSGKSTFLHALLRHFDPDDGVVMLDNWDTRALTLESLRGQLAFVPQSSYLFNLSIAENVRLGRPQASDDEVTEALLAAGFNIRRELSDLGAEAAIGENGGFLSGGQRQRVAIARALIRGAPVLLLDEASSALDEGNERTLLEALRAHCAAGNTVVYATHSKSAVEYATFHVTFESGRITGATARLDSKA